MSAITTIEKVLRSGVLTPELTIIPMRGATNEEIKVEEIAARCSFRPDHIALLKRWNGIALEVIRFFGCGEAAGEVGRLSELQLPERFAESKSLAIACDAAGFVYLQSADSKIFSFDPDGHRTTYLGRSIDDFVERLVFGTDATDFAGDAWFKELCDARVIERKAQ